MTLATNHNHWPDLNVSDLSRSHSYCWIGVQIYTFEFNSYKNSRKMSWILKISFKLWIIKFQMIRGVSWIVQCTNAIGAEIIDFLQNDFWMNSSDFWQGPIHSTISSNLGCIIIFRALSLCPGYWNLKFPKRVSNFAGKLGEVFILYSKLNVVFKIEYFRGKNSKQK